jgi:hypothetical protein
LDGAGPSGLWVGWRLAVELEDDASAPGLDEHVVIARRDVDTAANELLAVDRFACRHPSGVVQVLGEVAGGISRAVDDDRERGVERLREIVDQGTDRSDSSGRSADHDEIAAAHPSP